MSQIKVELECKDIGGGKYEVGSWFDDKAIVAPGYSSPSATCEEVADIADRLLKTFPGVPVIVIGPCIDCVKHLSHVERKDGKAIKLHPFSGRIRFE